MIQEFVYETPEILRELLTFLHTQADQVEIIELYSQEDSFHHLFSDPRNDSNSLLFPVWHESNVQGVGIMYRVIDVERLFTALAEHNFGGQTCRLKLTLADSFLPENGSSTMIHFEDGRPTIYQGETHDVELQMNVSDFSSMVVGAISFERLHTYSLSKISDERFVNTINQLFYAAQKPMCMTGF